MTKKTNVKILSALNIAFFTIIPRNVYSTIISQKIGLQIYWVLDPMSHLGTCTPVTENSGLHSILNNVVGSFLETLSLCYLNHLLFMLL
jgi:hypothetical protein